MVGSEDVDQVTEPALQLVVVIGDVAGKIRVAAVRLLDRAIFIVTVGRRFEERLRAILPIRIVVAFGLLELTLVDQPFFSEFLDGGLDLDLCRPRSKRLLKRKHRDGC